MTGRTHTALRVAMLVVIAVVALANAIGWVDPDLWIPFVCIIAVMGIGTRGGVLDAMPFVLLELSVVMVLGVATFSGSRDFVWAASVAVSVLAVGKIALLEMNRTDAPTPTHGTRGSSEATGATDAPGEFEPSAVRARDARPDARADEPEPAQPLGTVPADQDGHGAASDASAAPRPVEGPADGAAPPSADESARPRRRRERDDPTPVRRVL